MWHLIAASYDVASYYSQQLFKRPSSGKMHNISKEVILW